MEKKKKPLHHRACFHRKNSIKPRGRDTHASISLKNFQTCFYNIELALPPPSESSLNDYRFLIRNHNEIKGGQMEIAAGKRAEKSLKWFK